MFYLFINDVQKLRVNICITYSPDFEEEKKEHEHFSEISRTDSETMETIDESTAKYNGEKS